MIDLDTSRWARVGETSNAEYFAIERGVLALVPRKGAIEGSETARENARFLNDHGHREGRPVAVVAFVDRVAALDGGARKTYNTDADPTAVCGVALVGGSMLGRAVASVFLAIVKPRGMLFGVFGDYNAALVWARTLYAAQGPEARPPPAALRS
jgi:hypothetical protein